MITSDCAIFLSPSIRYGSYNIGDSNDYIEGIRLENRAQGNTCWKTIHPLLRMYTVSPYNLHQYAQEGDELVGPAESKVKKKYVIISFLQ